MLRVKTKIGVSNINGIGLFAEEIISKGTLIWEFHPNLDLILKSDDVEKLPEIAKRAFLHYAYKHSSGQYVLCFDDARFFNHSDNPNTIDDSEIAGKVYAARDIAKGEELTSDYRIFDADYVRKLRVDQLR